MGNFYEDFVTALYVAVYERAPDKDGLSFWVQQLEQGQTYEFVASNFIQHPVFIQHYNHLSNAEKVQAFYSNMLGAAGDQGGIDYWTNELNNGASISQVLSSFLYSSLTPLNREDFSDLSDAEWLLAEQRQLTLFNKVTIGNMFADYLADFSNITGDINGLDVESDPAYIFGRQIIAGITHQPETVNAARTMLYEDILPALQAHAEQSGPQPDDDLEHEFYTKGVAEWLAGFLVSLSQSESPHQLNNEFVNKLSADKSLWGLWRGWSEEEPQEDEYEDEDDDNQTWINWTNHWNSKLAEITESLNSQDWSALGGAPNWGSFDDVIDWYLGLMKEYGFTSQWSASSVETEYSLLDGVEHGVSLDGVEIWDANDFDSVETFDAELLLGQGAKLLEYSYVPQPDGSYVVVPLEPEYSLPIESGLNWDWWAA